MTTESEVRVALLRAELGAGPAHFVQADRHRGLGVWVVNQWMDLFPADALKPRIDRACAKFTGELMELMIVVGTPSSCPCQPSMPSGWMSLATVRIKAGAVALGPCDVDEGRDTTG